MNTVPSSLRHIRNSAIRQFLALAVLLTGTTMLAQAPQPDQLPDAIFVNGNVYTGAEEGFGGAPAKVYPRVQAFAVRNGRIIDVGSNDSIRRLKGPRTEVVDLAGHFVMPGLNDAHTHLR